MQIRLGKKIAVFWDLPPYSLVDRYCFRGSWRFHVQGSEADSPKILVPPLQTVVCHIPLVHDINTFVSPIRCVCITWHCICVLWRIYAMQEL
jgi:hypothetical protein